MLNRLAFWLRVAFLFLVRSTRTTAVLSLMILSAVAVMIFLAAMCVGINDAMIRNSVELFSGHITGRELPRDISREKLLVPGVKSVLWRSSTPGVLSHEGNLQTVAMIGVNPGKEAKNTALARKTVSGTYLESGSEGLYLSRSVAEKLRAEPGDEVRFRLGLQEDSVSLRVSGIYQTGFEQLDRDVAFCPENVMEGREGAWSAAVFLEEGTDATEVLALYRDLLPGEGVFQAWFELMPDLKQLVDLNYISMDIVLALVFGVVSLGIGCAFVIFILKNVREIGIMKAMGVTSMEMGGLIGMEVVLLSLLASCAGVVLGMFVTWMVGRTGIDLGGLTSQNRYFTVSGVIFPRLTPFSLVTPPFLAVFSGVAAALWPIAIVVRQKTADILRII